MAVTITYPGLGDRPLLAVAKDNQGRKRRLVEITGPASYTTGGEALSQGDLDRLMEAGRGIGDVIKFEAEHSTGGHTLVLDRANSKVMYFNGTTQIGAATNLSAVTVRVDVSYVGGNQ